MNRTTRTLLIVLLFSGVSIVALGWIAGRYGALLDERSAAGTASGAATSAESTLAAFIRVRSELREAIDPEGDGPPAQVVAERMPELLDRRRAALDSAGLADADYERVRKVYRKWRRRTMRAGEPLALHLERNRVQLEAVDLGAYETVDL